MSGDRACPGSPRASKPQPSFARSVGAPLGIVKRSDAAKGFVILPKRWIGRLPGANRIWRHQAVARCLQETRWSTSSLRHARRPSGYLTMMAYGGPSIPSTNTESGVIARGSPRAAFAGPLPAVPSRTPAAAVDFHVFSFDLALTVPLRRTGYSANRANHRRASCSLCTSNVSSHPIITIAISQRLYVREQSITHGFN